MGQDGKKRETERRAEQSPTNSVAENNENQRKEGLVFFGKVAFVVTMHW